MSTVIIYGAHAEEPNADFMQFTRTIAAASFRQHEGYVPVFEVEADNQPEMRWIGDDWGGHETLMISRDGKWMDVTDLIRAMDDGHVEYRTLNAEIAAEIAETHCRPSLKCIS